MQFTFFPHLGFCSSSGSLPQLLLFRSVAQLEGTTSPGPQRIVVIRTAIICRRKFCLPGKLPLRKQPRRLSSLILLLRAEQLGEGFSLEQPALSRRRRHRLSFSPPPKSHEKLQNPAPAIIFIKCNFIIRPVQRNTVFQCMTVPGASKSSCGRFRKTPRGLPRATRCLCP